MKIITCTHI